jgi:hypothetical protein
MTPSTSEVKYKITYLMNYCNKSFIDVHCNSKKNNADIKFNAVAMHINETFITIVHQIRNFVFNFRSGRGHCGRDRMVAGFTTTYEISVYHH